MLDSLRWRLPTMVSGLLGLLLAILLLTARREMERTLVSTAGFRARSAAELLAGLLSQSAQQRNAFLRRVATHPAVIDFLREPNDARRDAARPVIEGAGGGRRIELWTADGRRLFESPGTSARPIPPVERAPTGARESLQVLSDVVFADATVAVTPPDAPSGPPLGYIVYRSTVGVSPPGIIERLVGTDASVHIGQAGGLWTDLMRPVPETRAIRTLYGVSEREYASGERQFGHRVEVPGTSLMVWVGFPRDRIVAPAAAFAARMVVAGMFVMLAGAVGVWIISRRITRPLIEMAAVSDDIAAHYYGHHVPATRRDEIGQLARAFNRMAHELAEADRSLSASVERRELILATARVGMWESDPATGMVHCSDTMSLVHGTVARGTVSRDVFLQTVHQDDRADVARILAGNGGDEDVFKLDYRTVWHDGSVHWIEGIGRARRNDQNVVSILGASLDVTDQRSMETQLRQSQKMEAIGQLAGGLAHDFNNLLTAILGYGNLLMESLPPHGAARSDLDEILKAAKSAAVLTQQLLAFGRRQHMEPVIVNLNEIVSTSDGLLRRLIGEQIDLVTVGAPSLDPVRVDPAQLQQVIVNLAVNARDAMPDGGQLTISTANAFLDADYSRDHASVTPGPHVVLTVTDSGVGMDDETKARIFEPFFTTKELGKGTGLGLSTVYGIVKQSGGHIYVYSEVGRGTTFKIYLPAAPRSETTPAARQQASSVVGGSETILLVEDNPQALALAQTVLERLGYRVLVADSPKEAIEIVKERSDDIHLVVSDVIMPGLTGPELVRQLLATRPGLRVLFTSGYSDEAITRYGVLESKTKFLQKPYTPTMLAQKVRDCLDSPS